MKQNNMRLPAAIAALVLAGQLSLPAAVWAADSSAWDAGDLVIQEMIPDQSFRSWLLDGSNLDGAGADGVLTEQERQGVTELDLSGQGLNSLEGLEAFPNLETLDCSGNNLTELDVSKNPRLVRLYCGNNRLEELDLSANPELGYLSCSFNRLDRLDLTGHSKLVALNCEMNQMEELDLSGCGELLSLYCRNNNLTRLDLTDNGKLEFIETFDNSLTTIDVRHLTNLRFLHIDHNRLTQLDMSQNQKLEGGGFVVRNNIAEKIYLPVQPGLMIDREDYEEQDPVEGYDRVAWYLDPEFTLPVPDYLEAQGQTLYSQRIPNRYTIYFTPNGGSGSMAGIPARWGEEVQLPESGFSRYGYTFSHWSDQSTQDGTVHPAGERVQNLAGRKTDGDRITLYAQWTPNTYAICLDPGSGEGEPQTLSGVEYGTAFTLPEHTFHKEGQEFAGWSLTPEGEARYPDGGQVQNLTGENGATVTLYAVWRTPLSQVQRPYLEELEGLFQSYTSSGQELRYTAQDWEALCGVYAQAAEQIRSAALEEQMITALANGREGMAQVPTRQDRVEEVMEQWTSAHGEALGYLRPSGLTESNAGAAKTAAQEALDGLEADELGLGCPLERPEDRAQVIGLAQTALEGRAKELRDLQAAARWLEALGGLTLRPMEEVRSEDLNSYQQALVHYEQLEGAPKAYLSAGVIQGLKDRYELAGQKRGEGLALQSSFDSLDQTAYSSKGQAALAQALQDGLRAIEQAGSVVQAQQARTDAWARICQVPTASEEPTDPSQPPAGGGGSGGGGSAPEKPEESKPAEDKVETVTDERTGATAVVTTTPEGAVRAEVTLPQDVARATLGIPCTGNANTVAVLVEADGSRRVLPRSVYRDGVLLVQVNGSGRLEITEGQAQFTDVSEQDWFASAVSFTAGRELFSGLGGGVFGPNGSMTRAMLVTVLYRLEGQPAVETKETFSDVPQGAWYGSAAQWAAEQGITGGTGGGRFSPERAISRESLALMLYRCAGSPKPSQQQLEGLERFRDGGEISPWSREAMAWACGTGILAGDPQGRLMPQADSTRAQVAAMMAQFVALTTQ